MTNIKKQFLVNSIGSTTYNFSIWLLIMILPKFNLYEQSGYVALAHSVTAVFMIICSFNIRQYLIIDRLKSYKIEEYFSILIVTSLSSILLFSCYLFFMKYDYEVLLIIVFFFVHKLIIASCEVMIGVLQLKDRLDVQGISNFLSGMINICLFLLLYKISSNFVISMGITLICSSVVFFINCKIWFSVITKRKQHLLSIRINKELIVKIIPFLLISILPLIFFALPKVLLSKTVSSVELSDFSLLSTPATLISDFGFLIFVPIYNKISLLSMNENNSELKSLLKKIAILIISFILICLIMAFTLGKTVFSFLYGKEILNNINCFYIQCISMTIYLVSNILNQISAIKNKSKTINLILLLSIVLLFITGMLSNTLNEMSICILLAVCVQLILSSVLFFKGLSK